MTEVDFYSPNLFNSSYNYARYTTAHLSRCYTDTKDYYITGSANLIFCAVEIPI